MITIRITLLRDTFEGGRHDNPRVSEWPPSWMRLFSALVSVAEVGADDELLTTMEESDPPEIHASPHFSSSHRSAFVPTNATVPTTHTVLVGRTNGERGWARVAPKSRHIWYRWPGVVVTDAQLERLSTLCRRIPYVGRSTSPALVELVEEEPSGEALVPANTVDSQSFAFATTIRCPHPGALTSLRQAYEARTQRGEAGHPWEIGLGIDYGSVRQALPVRVIPSPYQTMVVFSIEGSRLDGRHTARVTHALRRAVLSRAEEHLPALHGHHDGDVLQCAFLGLPVVGNRHADGHLLGTAIALPSLAPSELRVIADALPAPGETLDVTAGPLGVLTLRRLSPLDAGRLRRGLDIRRWTGPARRWATALPIVFDRYPGRSGDLLAEVRRAVLNSRLPEPEEIHVSKYPVLTGGLRLAPTDTLRRRSEQSFRPYRHVVIRFAEEIEGIVVIGSMRHYGLGLCAPIDEVSSDE